MNNLEELEKTLFMTYNKNLNYLKNFHNNLFKKIQDFEKLNVETEYIDFENGYFEIKKVKSNENIYNCNSFYDSEYRAKNIKESNAIFSMLVKEIDSKNFNEENEISAHKIIKKVLQKKPRNLNTKKFIFIGTLLGIHINEIHKTNHHEVYFIIEPSIERFRLSLFFTDYEEISRKSKLFFSIEESHLELKKNLLNFLEYKFSFNHHIKFELASEKEYNLVKELNNLITAANPFINAFSEDIISLQRGIYNIKNSSGLIKTKSLNLFNDSPILILGAGPSLEEYQDFIKENNSKFIIICVGAALKRLEFLDIIPDFIINIDKKQKEILNQFEVNEKYYKDSIKLLGPKTSRKILEDFSKDFTFIIQENIEIFKNFETIDCVSAGDFATKLCVKLKATEIYLLGIDAAFTQNNTHDSFHLNNNNKKTNTYESEIIEVKGNFKEKVSTNLVYYEIINSFLSLTHNINIYNLSNGAKLANTKSLKIEDINISKFNTLNKILLKNEFLSKLRKNATSNISPLEIKEFQKEIKILKKIKPDFLEKDILELLRKYNSSKSLNIIYKYFKLITPYTEDKEIIKFYLLKVINELTNTFKNF